jgi:hypothetical protein
MRKTMQILWDNFQAARQEALKKGRYGGGDVTEPWNLLANLQDSLTRLDNARIGVPGVAWVVEVEARNLNQVMVRFINDPTRKGAAKFFERLHYPARAPGSGAKTPKGACLRVVDGRG